MVDINWGLLNSDAPQNIFMSYQRGREIGEAQQERERQRRAEEVRVNARQEAVQSLQSGDMDGARQAAIGAGDFDLLAHIEKMDERQHKAAQERMERFAVVGAQLRRLPYEQRKMALERMAPHLSDVSPEMIAGFDPTDEAIDATLASVMSAKDALARKVFQTRQGDVVAVSEMGGEPEVLYDGEAPAPAGYKWSGDVLEPIPGGPADPATIGRIAGTRREAVTSRPMPSRARVKGKGGGGGGKPRPAGNNLSAVEAELRRRGLLK